MHPRHPVSDSRMEENTEYQETTNKYFVCGHTQCIQRVESDSHTEENTEDQKERHFARQRGRHT